MTAVPETPLPSPSLLEELALLEGGADRPAVGFARGADLEVVTTPAAGGVPFSVRACARVRGAASVAGLALVSAGAALHLLPLPWPLQAGDAATGAGLAGVLLVGVASLLSVFAPRGRWSSLQVLGSPLGGRSVEVDDSSTGPAAYGRAHAVGLVLDVAVPDPAAVLVPGRRAALARRAGLLPVGDAATFGEPVLAPVDATVVRVVDGVRDHACRASTAARVLGGLLDAGRELLGARAVLGNHVVLDCGGGRYAVLAHLQRRSVRVSRGDRVLPGQVVGSAGCSGAVAEPQALLLCVDTPHLRAAAGVPVRLVVQLPCPHLGGSGSVTTSSTPLADAGYALGPLDGRYRGAVAPLVEHLSEAALNRERLRVEVEWLLHLTTTGAVPGARRPSEAEAAHLRGLVDGFGPQAVAEMAEVERETVHDVKAVEVWLRRQMAGTPSADLTELVHFCLTSEDVNNLSYALMLQGAVHRVWLPSARDLQVQLVGMAHDAADAPMLARTHGQPATPTTLGKELAVTAARLDRQLRRVERTEVLGKLNGATGTYAAHAVAVPTTDWQEVSRTFVEGLGLVWNPLTTQIESHDWQAELYSDVARFNRVLHDLCTDVWSYISLGYFAQVRGMGTVGSSTMPHKVNPIRFENAEANLEVSSALLDVLASTLVTSRLQRDLTDSSMQRNAGTAFGHSLLAIENARKGLAGLDVDQAAMARDLDANWEVLGEAVQSVMRAASVAGVAGMDDPYSRLKELTRGRRVDAEGMRTFVAGLGLPDEARDRLLALTPGGYTGLAAELARTV